MRTWRNGSRAGFRNQCQEWRVGSNPTVRTKCIVNGLVSLAGRF
jgi:hypothetical protein